MLRATDTANGRTEFSSMRNQFSKAMHADGADCGRRATESGSEPRHSFESTRRLHGTLIATSQINPNR